jgi:hypothetical protein
MVSVAFFTYYLRTNRLHVIAKIIMLIVMAITFLSGIWVTRFCYDLLSEAYYVKIQSLLVLNYLIGFLIVNVILMIWVMKR